MMRSSGTESRGLLSDSDWDEIAKLGIVDVILVQTPGSGFVTAVALLVHGPGAVQCWSLAERPSHDAARAAVRFLLAGLAGLRRLTKQKHPWAPGVGETDTDPEKAEARDQALRAAVDGWHRQVDASIREATLVDGAAALADERSRRAAAGAPIRSARKCLNVTQASLAEKAGINAAVLSEIERGIRVPDPATRDRIAHALDADTEHLFGRLEATVT